MTSASYEELVDEIEEQPSEWRCPRDHAFEENKGNEEHLEEQEDVWQVSVTGLAGPSNR